VKPDPAHLLVEQRRAGAPVGRRAIVKDVRLLDLENPAMLMDGKRQPNWMMQHPDHVRHALARRARLHGLPLLARRNLAGIAVQAKERDVELVIGLDRVALRGGTTLVGCEEIELASNPTRTSNFCSPPQLWKPGSGPKSNEILVSRVHS